MTASCCPKSEYMKNDVQSMCLTVLLDKPNKRQQKRFQEIADMDFYASATTRKSIKTEMNKNRKYICNMLNENVMKFFKFGKLWKFK